MAKKRPYEIGQDLESPNRNLSPITSELDDQGKLMIGGCLVSELAKSYGTPLYVLDEQTLRTCCRSYKKALRRYYKGESLPLYASKANSSLAISKIINFEGFGLDAVSEGELITALRAGIKGDHIVLHGNNKSYKELKLAYDNDVTIVIDNYNDIRILEDFILDKNKKANLMLRFTPGIECHTHEYIRTGHLDSKFGFDPDQLETVLFDLKEKNWAALKGLHAHIGSQIFELEPHRDLAGVMADVLKLAREMGHPLEDLNLGGGLGIRYSASDDPPSIDEWVQTISEAVTKACMERKLELPRLMCEPGRSLIASAGVTLYTVGSRKSIPGIRNYLSVDGGMSDNPRPITYESIYTACLGDKALSPCDDEVTIAGKHCESGDILIKDYSLPYAETGEILVIFATGAYNSSMSSNYNRIPRPAAVIVDNGDSDLIQLRENAEDLLRFDVFPNALECRLGEVGAKE